MIVNGRLIIPPVSIPDLTADGPIGSAASTVDVASHFIVNQTTANIAATLPSPTSPVDGYVIWVTNAGTEALSVNGYQIAPNQTTTFSNVQSSWNQAAAGSANERLFLSETTLAPAQAGAPTEAEFSAQIGTHIDTVVYYTGTDSDTDEPIIVYHVDSSGNLTLISNRAAIYEIAGANSEVIENGSNVAAFSTRIITTSGSPDYSVPGTIVATNGAVVVPLGRVSENSKSWSFAVTIRDSNTSIDFGWVAGEPPIQSAGTDLSPVQLPKDASWEIVIVPVTAGKVISAATNSVAAGVGESSEIVIIDEKKGILAVRGNMKINITTTEITAPVPTATYNGLQAIDFIQPNLAVASFGKTVTFNELLHEGDLLEVRHQYNGVATDRAVGWVVVEAGTTQRYSFWPSAPNFVTHFTFPGTLGKTMTVLQGADVATPVILAIKVWRPGANGFVVPSGTLVATPVNLRVNNGANTINGRATNQILEGVGAYHFAINMTATQKLSAVTVSSGVGATAHIVNADAGEIVVAAPAGCGDVNLTALFAAKDARHVFSRANAGTWVTIGSIKLAIPTSGSRSLQVRSASGSRTIEWVTWISWDTALSYQSASIGAASTQYLNGSYNFGLAGQMQFATIRDTLSDRMYEVKVQIGFGYNSNVFMLQELD